MSRFPCLLVVMVLSFVCSGQNLGPAPDINQWGRGFEISSPVLSLERSFQSGRNHVLYLPAGGIDFQVDNLAWASVVVMLVLVQPDGAWIAKPLRFEPGESKRIVRGDLQSAVSCYLMGLQPFGLNLEEPLFIDGEWRYYLEAEKPRQPLTPLQVTSPAGSAAIVGVDEQMQCHFPIFGGVIGVWRPKLELVVQLTGPDLKAAPFPSDSK